MRKEWILTEEEKVIKRQKIEQNRRIKKEAQKVLQQPSSQMILNHPEMRLTSFDVSAATTTTTTTGRKTRRFDHFSRPFLILVNRRSSRFHRFIGFSRPIDNCTNGNIIFSTVYRPDILIYPKPILSRSSSPIERTSSLKHLTWM